MTAAPAGIEIRYTRVNLVVALIVLGCVSPLVLSRWWLVWLLLLPVGIAVWTLRSGVDVDPDAGVTVRATFGKRRVPWERVAGLSFTPRGQGRLVLDSGAALRLPAVRARHLPLIAAASGGRIPDPTQETGPGSAVDTAPPAQQPPSQ